jgi:hypothetical protein
MNCRKGPPVNFFAKKDHLPVAARTRRRHVYMSPGPLAACSLPPLTVAAPGPAANGKAGMATWHMPATVVAAPWLLGRPTASGRQCKIDATWTCRRGHWRQAPQRARNGNMPAWALAAGCCGYVPPPVQVACTRVACGYVPPPVGGLFWQKNS